MLLADAIQDYMQHLAVERGLARQTLAAYSVDFRHLLDHLGKQQTVEATSRASLRGWLAARVDLGDSPRTQQRRWACVWGFFRWLRLEGAIEVEPTADIAWPEWEPRLPEILSVEEIEQLIAAPGIDTPAGLRDTAIIEFMYATASPC